MGHDPFAFDIPSPLNINTALYYWLIDTAK